MKIHFHLAILITHLPQLQRVGDTAPVFTGHQINTKFCSFAHQPLPKSVEDNFFHPTTPPHHFDVLLLRSVGVIIATTNKRDGRKKRKRDNDVFNIAEGANWKGERGALRVNVRGRLDVLFPSAGFVHAMNTQRLKSRKHRPSIH